MEISIYRACSEVVPSGIEMSAEADTVPVCGILEKFHRVEFLTKWPQHLRGGSFWKLQKIDLSHSFSETVGFDDLREGASKFFNGFSCAKFFLFFC